LKIYYNILGLKEGASKAEIKRAFRIAAMKYHPDRNPDPKAAILFAKVKEAYDILYNEKPQTRARRSRNHRQTNYEDPIQAAAAEFLRQKEARRKRNAEAWKNYAKEEIYFRKLTSGWRWTFFSWGSYALGLIAILLLLEFALPKHYEKDQFHEYSTEYYKGFRGGTIHVVGLKDQGKFWLEGGNYYYLSKHAVCFVEKTWFFHIPKSIVHPIDKRLERYPIEFGMAAYFPFSVLLFLIPFAVMRYKRKKTSFSILFHLSLFLLIPLGAIFLFTGDRWAHLLTLGFL
jgi:hypothetical protein